MDTTRLNKFLKAAKVLREMNRPSFLWRSLQSFGVNWCESGLREDRTSGHLSRLGSRFSSDSRASRDYFIGSASALFSLTSTMNNSPQQKYLHSDINFSKFFPSNIYYISNIIYHRSNIISIKTHIYARSYDLFIIARKFSELVENLGVCVRRRVNRKGDDA